ncbi:MAG TPA: SRPBCC domain-containing protein [Dehalococcoidia bacterium]|nr:SRPBCC domain-containing protein [Dehalococcoidia bacterium]
MSEHRPRSAVVTRLLPAPPEVVYDEWLDVDALAEFLCPYPAVADTVECDPRVGGRLRIDMVNGEDVTHVTGEYLELDRPNRLRFTWNSERTGDLGSVVTVTLEAHEEQQTLMTIEHARLGADQREDHERGWTRIAAQLERKLQARV